jgi:flagellar biosynthesis/type III secretory pathway protein FliH
MLLSSWYTKWKKKRIREAVEQARKQGYEEGYKVGKSEVREAATNSAQVSEREAASTSILPSEFSEREELTEYLKSDSHATKEKV